MDFEMIVHQALKVSAFLGVMKVLAMKSEQPI
jgi:hypothetical protein